MTSNDRVLNHENVNGFNLSLRIARRNVSNNAQRFTISYETKGNKPSWPIKSFVLAVIFNVLALCLVRVNITTIVVIVIVLSFLSFFWITHSVQSESILVIPTVGVQTSVKYVCGREDYFVPWSSIDDVIINEVIKLNRVLYFLTIIVKTSASSSQDMEYMKLIPLFKYTKPRLAMLEVIFSELQTLLSPAEAMVQKGSGDADGAIS